MKHISPDGIERTCRARIGKCRYKQILELSDLKEKDLISENHIYSDKSYLDIVAKAPKIRDDISKVVEDNNGKLEGLEFYIKSRESLATKILIRKTLHKVEDAWDVVRFTSVVNTENYVEHYNSLKEDLMNKGYKIISIRNGWGVKNVYKGLNIKLLSPDDNKIELQIHTPESLEAKERAHKLYEEQRLLRPSDLRFRELDNQMADIFNSVPNVRLNL